MQKKYFVFPAIIIALLSLGAASFSTMPPKEGFENLKVLPKDITKEKLDSVMQHFAISLGVKCNFCHAANADTSNHHLDFASDAKDEKNIARHMFEMTKTINANFFNPEKSKEPDTIRYVVCYTCHRGTKEPDSEVFLSIIDSTIQEHQKRRK